MELRLALITASTELVETAPPTTMIFCMTIKPPTTAAMLAAWEEPEIASAWQDLDDKIMTLPALQFVKVVFTRRGGDVTNQEATTLQEGILGMDTGSMKTIVEGRRLDYGAFFARVLPRVYEKGILQISNHP